MHCGSYPFFSPQTWLSNPTYITWKGEMMVAGDSVGMLFFYDSKAPSRSVQLDVSHTSLVEVLRG